MSTTIALGRFGAVISRGLRQILSEGDSLRVLAVELDNVALEAIVVQQGPQVAILDEAVAPAMLRRLRAADPGIGLIVLAYRPTPAYGMRLLGFGANACLAKDISASDLLTTIRLAAEGKYVLAPIAGRAESATELTAVVPLTPREEEVLELLRIGWSNGEIALALHVSIETVRTHAAHIYQKLGVRTRRDLMGWDTVASRH
jgi:DNA-binding NarL/FixJ family response regulator